MPSAKGKGKLIVAANSLGCSDDIPVRALEALRCADLVIFEELKPARQTLKKASIHRDFLRLSEHEEKDTIEQAGEALKNGKSIIYMPDQGCANICDPGRQLLEVAYGLGSTVSVIPGPSAITAALAACPFDTSRFLSWGYLPRQEDKRLELLNEISRYPFPTVILDTPYRLRPLLSACEEAIGSHRRALLALDITGESEAFHYETLAVLKREYSGSKKLNFVLVIENT